MAEKQKVIFLLGSGVCFCFTFFSWSLVNDKSYHSGQIWPTPKALVYLASGLLLERPPLLSLFPHCT
jgi:hypothetical protein